MSTKLYQKFERNNLKIFVWYCHANDTLTFPQNTKLKQKYLQNILKRLYLYLLVSGLRISVK